MNRTELARQIRESTLAAAEEIRTRANNPEAREKYKHAFRIIRQEAALITENWRLSEKDAYYRIQNLRYQTA